MGALVKDGAACDHCFITLSLSSRSRLLTFWLFFFVIVCLCLPWVWVWPWGQTMTVPLLNTDWLQWTNRKHTRHAKTIEIQSWNGLEWCHSVSPSVECYSCHCCSHFPRQRAHFTHVSTPWQFFYLDAVSLVHFSSSEQMVRTKYGWADILIVAYHLFPCVWLRDSYWTWSFKFRFPTLARVNDMDYSVNQHM